MKFTVALKWDPKGRVYNVSVPALPGCFALGKTKVKALRNARCAIRTTVDAMKSSGESVPQEVGVYRVRVS